MLSLNDKEQELIELKEDLRLWKAARRALSLSKSYQINGRMLTRVNYLEVRQAVLDLEIEISQIEKDMQSYMRVIKVIPGR